MVTGNLIPWAQHMYVIYPNDTKLELYHVMTKRYHLAAINNLISFCLLYILVWSKGFDQISICLFFSTRE